MTTPNKGCHFSHTRWTQVLAAANPEHPDVQEALAALCGSYWRPLYSYVRRQGHSPEDAEDLTQGFFARLLRLDSLANVRRERGRFRSFLLGSMRNYLSDARDHERAAKRGKNLVVSIETDQAESGDQREPSDPAATPDQAFDRAWALALLDRVTACLQQDYADAGQDELFKALGFSLTGSRSAVPYAELAARLGMNEPAVRVAVHRLRTRYRQLLRDEIARTVPEPEDIDDELRHLRRALAG
jgi:RNA polymerase sigma factor (sigma-70 family)